MWENGNRGQKGGHCSMSQGRRPWKEETTHLSCTCCVLRLKLLQYVTNIDNVKSAVTRKGKIHCIMKNGRKMTVDNPDDLFHLGVTDIDYGEFGLPIL